MSAFTQGCLAAAVTASRRPQAAERVLAQREDGTPQAWFSTLSPCSAPSYHCSRPKHISQSTWFSPRGNRRQPSCNGIRGGGGGARGAGGAGGGGGALTIGSVPRRTVFELRRLNFIDCSFSTTNENDVILGRSYAGPILPLLQRPPEPCEITT